MLHLTKFLPHFFGGIERVTMAMAMAGKQLGHSVHVIGAQPENTVELPKMPFEQTGLKCLFQLGPVPVTPELFFISSHLEQAEVIHVYLPNPLATAYLLSYLAQHPEKKVVTIINAPIMRAGALGKAWQDFAFRSLLNRSQRFVITCEQMYQSIPLLEQFKEKAAMIPNPIEPDLKPSQPAKTDEKFRMIAIGRLVPYKGFDVLIDAVKDLSGDWKLSIVGKGPEYPKLKEAIEKNKLTEKVHLLQGVSEKKKFQLLHESDLFVLPSTSIAEAYGVVIGEAFYCKKPVITTRLPSGVSFLSRNGECGAAVPPNSPEALKKAIVDLMGDAPKRLKCGELNYAFWKRELRMQTFVQRYQTLIEDITRIKPKTAA